MQARAALRLREPKTDRVLAEQLEVPTTFLGRGLGLSFRNGLEQGRGMWIQPCNGIHMFFMRFPLDIIFLDAHNRVRSVHRRVRPWIGMVPLVRGAKSVIELPAGALDGLDLQRGDQLELEPGLAR